MPAFLSLEAHAAGSSKVKLSCDGVLGDHVSLGQPSQLRPTIVFFMSRRAQDESSSFARAIDEQLLDVPIEEVGVVDTHRYGGLLRGIAMRHLKSSANEALQHRRERRINKGVDASPERVNCWHLIGDFDGSLFALFGVEPEPAHPLAFVVDRSGTVAGPFRDVAGVLSAGAIAEATTH